MHNKKNENQEVLKQHLQGMPKFKPKKTDKEMFLYEAIGENNFKQHTKNTVSGMPIYLRSWLRILKMVFSNIQPHNQKKNCILRKQEENPIFTNIMFLNTTNHPILSPPTYTRMVSVTSTRILLKKGL